MSAPEPKAPASDLDAAVGRGQLDRLFYGGGEYVRADEAIRQIMALQAALSSQSQAAEGMAKALDDLQEVFAHDGEDSMYRFERLAEMFRKDTGYLAPGKDPGMSSCQPDGEELRAIYDAWFVAKVTRARTALSHYRTLGDRRAD